MAVLPESMDKLNVDDPNRSLSVIENYIRYMAERIEFSMRNVTKTVSAAGVSSAEMYILITAMQHELSALRSTVNGMYGDVNSLAGRVAELQTKADGIAGELSSLQTRVNGLDQRIAALEQNNGG